MIVPVLMVKSVDESIKFYNEKFGFKTDMVLAGPDGVNSFAGISLGTSTFMLGLASESDDTAHAGTGVVFMVYLPDDGDIDAVYADVQAKGLAIVEGLKTEYWGDRVFSVKDPDGYYLTIAKTVHQADMNQVAKIFSGQEEA
jgi:PhnB protein